MDLLLGHFLVNVLDKKVRGLLELVLGVADGVNDAEGLVVKHEVIHGITAFIGIGLGDKLEVAVAARLLGLAIKHNLSALHVVALVREELEEIEVEEVLLR